MKVMLGDTIVLKEESGSPIAIVTQRSGGLLTVRRPDKDNQLEKVPRDAIAPLALWMAQAREGKTKFSNSLSLTGGSTPCPPRRECVFNWSRERSRPAPPR